MVGPLRATTARNALLGPAVVEQSVSVDREPPGRTFPGHVSARSGNVKGFSCILLHAEGEFIRLNPSFQPVVVTIGFVASIPFRQQIQLSSLGLSRNVRMLDVFNQPIQFFVLRIDVRALK